MIAAVLLLLQEDWGKTRARFEAARDKRPLVRELARADRIEAAELVVRTLAHADPALQAELLQACASFRDPAAVRFLMEELTNSRSDGFRETMCAAARHLPLDGRGKEALKRAARRDPTAPVRAEALASTAAFGIAETDAILAALADPHWRVRRAAAMAAAKLDLFEAVPSLIAALEGEGPLRSELNAALVVLTGVDKHGDFAAWKSWWEERRFERPSRADREAMLAREEGGTRAEFYGLTIESKRVFFLLDVSGSMEGKKILAARHEVRRALEAMPPDAEFGIAVFTQDVRLLEGGMRRATRENRLDALAWLEAIEPDEGTDLKGALDVALSQCGVGRARLYADAIYLVTDGRMEPGFAESALKRVRERNPYGLVRIHAVAVGADADRTFLRTLAEENEGSFSPP